MISANIDQVANIEMPSESQAERFGMGYHHFDVQNVYEFVVDPQVI